MKNLLRATFSSVLDRLDRRLRERLRHRVGASTADLGVAGRVLLIAIGKAARSMAEPVLPMLPEDRVDGLLVPPEPDDAPLPPLAVQPGGHPLPTAGSFAAARRALAQCRAAGPADRVVFLISGGGSAMCELPIDPTATVADWQRLNRALIGCGGSIERINAVRMRLSAVKGGRLALAARHARTLATFYVVDVPGDARMVASGPTAHFPDLADTLRQDIDELGLGAALPRSLAKQIATGTLPQLTPLPEELVQRSSWSSLLTQRDAGAEAAAFLADHGIAVARDDSVDDWPLARAADHLLNRLGALRPTHPGRPVALVATGELSVKLPDQPGQGGRNQQFLLHCARRIAGQPITVLSCGTDGVDGNSPAAGAVVDGSTLRRAVERGFDVDDHLARCDAFPLLAALGDTVITGPTGTNVRDLRVLVYDA